MNLAVIPVPVRPMETTMPSTQVRQRIRDLAKRYVELCHTDRNDRARELWRDHNSLRKTRPPVVCCWYFASRIYDEIEPHLDELLAEEQPYRALENWLRLRLWGGTIPDDTVYYPWYVMWAKMQQPSAGVWGFERNRIFDAVSRGWRNMPVITELEDLKRLEATPHVCLDDESPEIRAVGDLIGDILPVHVNRSTVYPIWGGTDLSEAAGSLLGLTELMLMLYDNPALVHELMAFTRDAVLANLDQGQAAGDWSLADGCNYAMPPDVDDLPAPAPNSHGAALSDLWFFTHAQEFEAVSPAQHEEFLLQYQMPIMAKFGLVNYGCCETLDNKIDMLGKIPNLRRILMGPRVDLARGCEQIGRRYVVSWRPNPTMVSGGFDPDAVRATIRRGFADAAGCNIEIMLKELMTVDNDLSRLFRWTEIAMAESHAAGGVV